MTIRHLFLGLVLTLPISCAMMDQPDDQATRPVMQWDHHPEAPIWTERTLLAVAEKDSELAMTVPTDIETWCPAYPEASLEQRRAFWTGVLSALAKYESTWNPVASGGGGQWIGLTQISPRTANYFGCEATSAGELKDGAANLTCAVEIAAVQVPKDNLVAGNGAQGLGRDWAPFRDGSKRNLMAAWTRQQSYCRK